MAGDDDNNDFCENYLLLKPEEASCFDLVRILCCNNLERRDFFNTRVEGGLIGFRHRWIVFVSVFLQKVLIFLKKPMAVLGFLLELSMNYPPFNGGYGRLFLNLLTGKVVRPDKSSARFTSVVGNLDKRWNLDKNIGNKSSKYIASLAIMASKLSYENQSFVRNVVTNNWQMEFLEFYSFWNDYQGVTTTYAIMFRDKTVDPNLIIVAFRGTDPFDADAYQTDIDLSWYQFAGVGKIHGGFMKALGLQRSSGWPQTLSSSTKSFAYYTIRDKLKTLIAENKNAKFVLTGHSLGGALAILFAGVLIIHEEEALLRKLGGIYTFGQPRVGDGQFGDFMKAKLGENGVKYCRYVYCNDVVARLPYDDRTFLFKHFGPSLYFDSCYRGEVLEEEPNKNYFSLIHFVPKILNAVYELIRSFVLPWMKGDDYREGWLMRLFRVIALFIPGLIDHFPVNYVNLTRLGKSINPDQGPNQNLKQD